MSDQDALLRAILDNPADDTIRLVYADWLEEHPCDHHLAQAEFIRLSCVGKSERTKDYRLRPMPDAAFDWLVGNWRRLVPRLTQDWDEYAALYASELKKYLDCQPGLPAVAPNWVGDDLAISGFGMAEPVGYFHPPRGRVAARVPFPLPTYEGNVRWYLPVVQLTCRRGFVKTAKWGSLNMGGLIAERLVWDQPLASQEGPSSYNDPLEALATLRRNYGTRTNPA